MFRRRFPWNLVLLGVFVSIVIAGREANVGNGAPDPYGRIKNMSPNMLIYDTVFFAILQTLALSYMCGTISRFVFFGSGFGNTPQIQGASRHAKYYRDI